MAKQTGRTFSSPRPYYGTRGSYPQYKGLTSGISFLDNNAIAQGIDAFQTSLLGIEDEKALTDAENEAKFKELVDIDIREVRDRFRLDAVTKRDKFIKEATEFAMADPKRQGGISFENTLKLEKRKAGLESFVGQYQEVQKWFLQANKTAIGIKDPAAQRQTLENISRIMKEGGDLDEVFAKTQNLDWLVTGEKPRNWQKNILPKIELMPISGSNRNPNVKGGEQKVISLLNSGDTEITREYNYEADQKEQRVRASAGEFDVSRETARIQNRINANDPDLTAEFQVAKGLSDPSQPLTENDFAQQKAQQGAIEHQQKIAADSFLSQEEFAKGQATRAKLFFKEDRDRAPSTAKDKKPPVTIKADKDGNYRFGDIREGKGVEIGSIDVPVDPKNPDAPVKRLKNAAITDVRWIKKKDGSWEQFVVIEHDQIKQADTTEFDENLKILGLDDKGIAAFKLMGRTATETKDQVRRGIQVLPFDENFKQMMIRNKVTLEGIKDSKPPVTPLTDEEIKNMKRR